ncbi:hypothetical protein [Spirosoma jeollabukense]
MVAQHKITVSVDDRKKTRSLPAGRSADYTWTWLIAGFIFLAFLWHWFRPMIDAAWLMVDKWRVFLHYH